MRGATGESRATSSSVFALFPRLEGAAQADGRHALGRRAADARDRARADVAAAACCCSTSRRSASRRSSCTRSSRRSRRSTAGHARAARRAERQRGAAALEPRLRARDGPRRARGNLRGGRREPEGERGVSGGVTARPRRSSAQLDLPTRSESGEAGSVTESGTAASAATVLKASLGPAPRWGQLGSLRRLRARIARRD